MTELPVFTFAPASAHDLVFSLDCARAESCTHSWIASFHITENMSESERRGLAVLAAAHGAWEARGDGGTRLVALGSELDDALKIIAAREDESGDIALVCANQEGAEGLKHWHRSAWEAGYSLRLASPKEWAHLRSKPLCPLVICAGAVEPEFIEDECRQGRQVIWDTSKEDENPQYTDSEIVAYRISRAHRTFLDACTPPSSSPLAPGPLLREVSPLLKRAMKLLGDPPPAARTLNASPAPLRNIGASEQVIASCPQSSDPILTYQPCASGGLWRISARLDAATRRALLALVAAVAYLAPPQATVPDGVEAVHRSGALFLFNHADRARELSAVIGRDAVSESECTGHALLGPASAMLLLEAGEHTHRRA